MSSITDRLHEKEAEYEQLLLEEDEARMQIANTKKLLQKQLSLLNEILATKTKNPFHKE